MAVPMCVKDHLDGYIHYVINFHGNGVDVGSQDSRAIDNGFYKSCILLPPFGKRTTTKLSNKLGHIMF